MLDKEIKSLISLKTEGGYWDFKQEWPVNHDLLHDIICMANNLEDRDAYIIIGIADDGEVCGISDRNRKNQENLITFLRDKKFAGGVRPTVYVQTLEICDKVVDVIIIKNTMNTPYYLVEDYKGVFKGSIYTRVIDTNTPKTGNADIDKVEWLWKKRFGLIGSIQSKIERILSSDGWICEDAGEWNERFFNEHYPEVRIDPVISDKERLANDSEEYDDAYLGHNLAHDSFYWLYANRGFWNLTGNEKLTRKWYTIKWYGNKVYEFPTVKATRQPFDFVEPKSAFLNSEIGIMLDNVLGLGAYYSYFIKGNYEYLLFKMIRPLQADDNYMEKYGYYPGNRQKALCLNVVPVFESEVEYETFIKYIFENNTCFKSKFDDIDIDDMFSGGEMRNDPRIGQSLKLGKLMVIWLERWRMCEMVP